MGIEDGDRYRDAMREKAKQDALDATKRKFERYTAKHLGGERTEYSPGRSLLFMVLFWLLIMGIVYAVMHQVLEPKRPKSSGSGAVEISRSNDGHFRTIGAVNGVETIFLIDTGASIVAVSEAFAQKAALLGGSPMVFNTANGQRPGRLVNGITVGVGPLTVRNVDVGIGISADGPQEALLGQSFLRHFDVTMSGSTLVLRPRN